MPDKRIVALSELAESAQKEIQKQFSTINPVLGVSRKMREKGFPVDLLTIDCVRSKKRITLILHDQSPDIASYQFSFTNKDTEVDTLDISYAELTEKKLFNWMKEYLS